MPGALEITFIIVSMIILGVIFMTKSKAHAGDARIRRPRDRQKDQRKN